MCSRMRMCDIIQKPALHIATKPDFLFRPHSLLFPYLSKYLIPLFYVSIYLTPAYGFTIPVLFLFIYFFVTNYKRIEIWRPFIQSLSSVLRTKGTFAGGKIIWIHCIDHLTLHYSFYILLIAYITLECQTGSLMASLAEGILFLN